MTEPSTLARIALALERIADALDRDVKPEKRVAPRRTLRVVDAEHAAKIAREKLRRAGLVDS